MCFSCVRFRFLSTMTRDWLGRTSPKWRILCWVGRKTNTKRAVKRVWWCVVVGCKTLNTIGFDTVSWMTGRASNLWKLASVILMLLFWNRWRKKISGQLANPSSARKWSLVKWCACACVCVCTYVCVCVYWWNAWSSCVVSGVRVRAGVSWRAESTEWRTGQLQVGSFTARGRLELREDVKWWEDFSTAGRQGHPTGVCLAPWAALAGCSSASAVQTVQLSINEFNAELSNTWWNAAFQSLTLPVGSALPM